MNYYQILKITGIILLIFSFFLLLPIAASMIYEENINHFLYSFLIIFLFGLLTYLPNKDQKTQIKVREGFFIVALFWFILSFFGSLPFFMDESLNLSFVDAVFESTSGWTTTGATIITNLDDLNKSLLLYRQLLQWLGGIGVIVMAIAIFPMLSVGGMQLFKAENFQ